MSENAEFKGTQEEWDALIDENKEEPKSILREIMFGETPEPEPWGITFSWKDKAAKIKFKNGEDILKLAEVFSQYLTANGIENTLEKE